jgi:hypothetical protein
VTAQIIYCTGTVPVITVVLNLAFNSKNMEVEAGDALALFFQIHEPLQHDAALQRLLTNIRDSITRWSVN